MKKVFRIGLTTFLLLLTALFVHPKDFPAAKPESQGISSAALKKLVEIVSGYVESGEVVGAELVIIKNRHTVLHEVFGWRDLEDKIPMAKNTMFNIRSMTKPITAAAAQVLIDEGKLKLTDRAADYLPGFKNKKSETITIEQLLTHRSGLPLSVLKGVKDMQKYKDLFTLANVIGKGGPEFEPGSKFWYSDAGANVLGAVIEVVSGMPLDDFFKQRLLKPLGMEDTFALTKKDNSPRDRASSLYFGTAGAWKKFWKPADEPFYPFAWGSQTLYSTPQDYARFLAMWLDGGKIGDKRLLSNEAIKRTLTPVSEMTSLGSDTPSPTGFPGFKVYYGQMAMLYADSNASDSKKPLVIGHNGSDGTFAWAWPEHDLMILYFTQSRGQATGLRLETEIHKLLIDPNALKEITDIPEQFKPYVGKYTANFAPNKDTVLKVFVQNGTLAVDIPGQMIFELNEPDEEGLWYFKLTKAIYVSFQKSGTGSVTDMIISQVIRLPKKVQPEAEPVDKNVPEKYRPYLGKYPVPMQNIELTVIFKDSNLAVDNPREGIVKMQGPDKKGRWIDQFNKNKIFFDIDDSGKVTMNIIVRNFIKRGEPAALIVEKVIENSGIKEGLKKYHELKQKLPDGYFFNEKSINRLGYRLLGKDKIAEAVEIFKLNAAAYPESWNVYDSLGEAYMKQGDKELAVKNFRKSLELNPENKNGKEMLEKLEREK